MLLLHAQKRTRSPKSTPIRRLIYKLYDCYLLLLVFFTRIQLAPFDGDAAGLAVIVFSPSLTHLVRIRKNISSLAPNIPRDSLGWPARKTTTTTRNDGAC